MAFIRSKRHFLKNSVYLTSLFLPKTSFSFASPLPGQGKENLKILGLGSSPSVLFLNDDEKKLNGDSVLFGYGNLRRPINTNIPINAGHSIERLDKGHLVCVPGRGRSGQLVVLNEKSFKITEKIDLPKGFGASGHVFNDRSRKRLFIPIERLGGEINSYDSNGRLVIYNYRRKIIEKNIDLKGNSPHQVRVLPKKKQIVVSFYGRQGESEPESVFKNSHQDSKLAIIDPNSFKILKEFQVPGNSYVSHFGVDNNDKIYMPLIDYAKMNKQGRIEAKKRLGTKTEYIPLSAFERAEEKISLPESVLVLDTENFKYKKIGDHVAHQRGPQTVYFHERTQQIFISYFVSDYLMVIDTLNGKVRYLSAFDIGVENIRGIYGDGKSREIYISGHRYGVAVIDDSSLILKKKIKGHTYGAAHIFKS